MKNGKYASRRRGVSSKVLALTLALVLVVGGVVGGTLAWLTDSTAEVKNTFTTSDVDIELAETTGTQYKMVPGYTIAKDPTVTVKAVSEKAYLFVKVEKSANFDTYMTYAMDESWTALENVDGVYYQVVEDAAADQTFAVIKDNKVTVRDSVTKEIMNALTAETYPTLTVTAYACQYYKSNVATEDDASGTPFTAAEAWANVQPSTAG